VTGNYFLITLFEHTNAMKDKFGSREVGENRVRKAYSWDSVELERRSLCIYGVNRTAKA
jgi:hypothetical protein